MIAFKGAIGDFFTISSQRRELSPTRTLKWPGRNYVQHIERLSRASLMLRATWTDEGGEETGVPRENPWRRASENATY